ncbi:MAG: hypothetical protein VX445_02980, partial [Pseudomonadota bacterium]|nr:hypothetical protein [Pseudomonadota bacterium]
LPERKRAHAHDVDRQCIMNSRICTDAGGLVGYKAHYYLEVSLTMLFDTYITPHKYKAARTD